MKTIFFTILGDSYKQYIQYDYFIKSFIKFHPDIPLVIVGDQAIANIIKEKPWVNFYNMKASVAKIFYNDYDLVVNIDADHFIFDRLDEVLSGDYDVACPCNANLYENVGLSIKSYQNNEYNIVPENKYIQAGLIASTSKQFWDNYEYASRKHAMPMTCKDNDVLNLVLEFCDLKFKVLDGGYGPNDVNLNCFYGCASLNLESKAQVINNKVYINNKPLKCYHVVKGHLKPKFNQIFNQDVVNWFNSTVLT